MALNRPTCSNLPSAQPTSMEHDDDDSLDNEMHVAETVSIIRDSKHPPKKEK